MLGPGTARVLENSLGKEGQEDERWRPKPRDLGSDAGGGDTGRVGEAPPLLAQGLGKEVGSVD